MFQSYDLQNFGNELRKIRKNCGYTQKDIQRLTGLNTDTLRKIENGHVIPKYETMEVLSIIYRYDLLRLLIQHRNESFMLDFSTKMDRILLENDTDSIENMIDAFQKFKAQSDRYSKFVFNIHINQYEQFIYIIDEYYNSPAPNFEAIKTNLIKVMRLTIPEFQIELMEAFRYNFFEMRVLMLIAETLRRTDQLVDAIRMFTITLDGLMITPVDEANNHELILKTFFLLAYCHHTADDDSNAFKTANEGIAFARRLHSAYCLPQLLFRKGVSERFLGKEEYKDTIQMSINLLHIMGHDELAETYKQVSVDHYDMKF